MFHQNLSTCLSVIWYRNVFLSKCIRETDFTLTILLLSAFLPGACQHSCKDGVHLNMRAITCTSGSPYQTAQKNVFPTVWLNDCAVCSGLNEVKEKSCWEFLLILYQQLTSIVLHLWEWVEYYGFKVVLIWQNCIHAIRFFFHAELRLFADILLSTLHRLYLNSELNAY